MTIKFEDKTGAMTSVRDREGAIEAIKKVVVGQAMMQIAAISPELAVNLPNILRCLQEHHEIRTALDGRVPTP